MCSQKIFYVLYLKVDVYDAFSRWIKKCRKRNENCIVKSSRTIRTYTRHVGDKKIEVIVEKNERYKF